MITCVVEHTVDAEQLAAFDQLAGAWVALVDVNGGQHHRYFLVAEGASDRTLAPFSLPSLAAYEDHRALSWVHPDFIAADQIRATTGCVSRYDGSFMRSLVPDSDERSTIRPRRPAEAEQ